MKFIRRLKRSMGTLKHLVKYSLKNMFCKEDGVYKSNEPKETVISLTSYNKRIKTVFFAIESIMDQSDKADRVILWLSNQDITQDRLPNSLKRLQSRGLEIYFVDENIKSYKKLIYTLEKSPHSDIITVDDDIFYPNDFIAELKSNSKKFPDCVIANRAKKMTFKNDNELDAYLNWSDADEFKPSLHTFPTGMGGVLYPPESLSQEVFNTKEFTELAPNADDVWFKAMTLLNNTDVVFIPTDMSKFYSVPQIKRESLFKKNKFENDIQIKAVFDKYDLYNKF